MGEFICQQCGKEIEDGEEWWNNSGDTFCSEKCKKKYQSEHD
jgi:endogenous inhibitor of DNA gyrase (YacG/DUF329 family)